MKRTKKVYYYFFYNYLFQYHYIIRFILLGFLLRILKKVK